MESLGGTLRAQGRRHEHLNRFLRPRREAASTCRRSGGGGAKMRREVTHARYGSPGSPLDPRPDPDRSGIRRRPLGESCVDAGSTPRSPPETRGFYGMGRGGSVLLKSLSRRLGADKEGIRRLGYKYEGGNEVAHQIRTVLARGLNETEASCVHSRPGGRASLLRQNCRLFYLSNLGSKVSYVGVVGKSLAFTEKKMGVMNIAVSRKKMHPPAPSMEEWSGGFAQRVPEATV